MRDVSLTLPAGSSVVLLGENGAGKSTLLRIIAGLAAPSLGSVRVFGEAPLDIRERLAYMSHATMLYDEMTARENLEYFATLYGGYSSLTPPAESLQAVGLDPANPRRIGEYSQGMRQRAALARTLMTSPDLLLLDEPFSNLDVHSAKAMVQRLQQYLATPGSNGVARTLLLTTHQAELAQPLAGNTIHMSAGRIVSQTGPTA
ncbi:MAG: ABC transporter ATP-binding protein [Acidobacteriaceae bacterium]|nr:ABC transporter ATP-binding protein [Acidobacteriaceae bacterium]